MTLMSQSWLPTLGWPALIVGPVFFSIELTGTPGHKGRHRSRIAYTRDRKAYIHTYPDPDTAAYEKMLAHYAQVLMRWRQPTRRPVAVLVHAFRKVPASWPATEREQALAGYILPMPRPDADNHLKILDALNEIVWHDDSQIIDARVIKRYSDRPALRIEVREFIEPPRGPCATT